MIDLKQGDCLELLQLIPDKSIDLVLADLPYGTTRNKWDSVIPLEPLWKEYRRIIKDHGVIALHSDMPFTVKLVAAGMDLYRYQLIWEKPQGTDFLNANRKPMKSHETVEIFYKHLPVYNKQKKTGKPYRAVSGEHKSENWGAFRMGFNTDCPDGSRNPTPVLKFNQEKGLHPTQKPVALEEWIIKTYTNPGDTVLDNTMGSGTVGVACVNTDRNFIGMENDPEIFLGALRRINAAVDDNGRRRRDEYIGNEREASACGGADPVRPEHEKP